MTSPVTPIDATAVHGSVAPGLEPVAEAFRASLAVGGPQGAALAVWRGDEPLVDLWGGLRDPARGTPWTSDTLVGVFSTTKGVAALVLALAHARGWLDYDAPIAEVWPEFGCGGKDAVSARTLLAHQAGLPALERRLTPELVGDRGRLAELLARQEPRWPPGAFHGYHALTLGFYQNELFRRIEPGGRSIGTFLREELCPQLGVEFHLGLPDSVDLERVAVLRPVRLHELLLAPRSMPLGMTLRLALPWTLSSRALRGLELKGPVELVGPRYRHLEIPSGNGIGTARSIARMYGAVAAGGRELGLDRRTLEELSAPAAAPRAGLRDLVLHTEVAYSLGFSKPGGTMYFGTSETSFGAAGAGGSFGYADPELGIGYAYVTNRMGKHLFDDPREKASREALQGLLGR